MKIAFFVSQFPSVSETFIVNQIIALRASGHLVHVFSPYRNEGILIHNKIIEAGLFQDTFYLDPIQGSFSKKLFLFISKWLRNLPCINIVKLIKAKATRASELSFFESLHFIDKPCYDVLHAHFGMIGNYVVQIRKLGLYGDANFITSFHGFDLNEKYGLNSFYTALFNQCKTFTVNSNFSKKKLIRLGCNEGGITVLPVGLNIENFKRKSFNKTADDTIRLIFVGRLIPLKGPDVFVEICHKLNQLLVSFKATIIGDGLMWEQINLLITHYGLDNIVEMNGAKSQDDVMKCMNNADVFILPGYEIDGNVETQGLVIQEAQAMELPVLVSNAGGMPEGVIDGVTGFVLPVRDIDGFIDKIRLLVNDVPLRKKMGKAGRKFIEEKFDIDVLNERLIELYRV